MTRRLDGTPPASAPAPAAPVAPAALEVPAASLAPPAAVPDWSALHRAACAPYRAAGRFAWHFARGKLGRDPVFRHGVAQGLFQPAGPTAGSVRLTDIGCGQGLLASLLAALQTLAPAGPRWHYLGIDLMPRDVDRARAALGALPSAPDFVCADMREVELPLSDVTVIFDVLHYVDEAAQQRVLERVRDALAPRGRLLLRVGDRAAGAGYAVSQWVDRAVTRVRGHAVAPTWGRPLADWTALLHGLGFAVSAQPMSRGTPFANVLLVADLGAAAAPDASEPVSS